MSGHRPFSELYDSMPAARREAIDSEVEAALSNLSATAHGESKFVIYREIDSLYRWRLVGATGQTLAESPEHFRSRSECLEAIGNFRHASATLAIEEAA